MPQELEPIGNWLQIAREYRERYTTLAEEFASRQDSHSCADAVTISGQFSKILRLLPGSVDPSGQTSQTDTFLEHLAEILRQHAMQSGDCIRFNRAQLAETYNEARGTKPLARAEHAGIFLAFFVEVGAICHADPDGYMVSDPEILLDIIESGKAPPDHPATISGLTIDVIYLHSVAKTFASQGKTHEAFQLRETARILHQLLQEHINDESAPPA